MIGVIGAGACDSTIAELARETGRLLAGRGAVVVTGGLGGVMAAAAEGARLEGGMTVAIVPGADPKSAHPHAEIVIATGMGEARNAIIANTCCAFVAISGGWGTLSEIAFALRQGKRVVSLRSFTPDPAVLVASTPLEAVDSVLPAHG